LDKLPNERISKNLNCKSSVSCNVRYLLVNISARSSEHSDRLAVEHISKKMTQMKIGTNVNLCPPIFLYLNFLPISQRGYCKLPLTFLTMPNSNLPYSHLPQRLSMHANWKKWSQEILIIFSKVLECFLLKATSTKKVFKVKNMREECFYQNLSIL